MLTSRLDVAPGDPQILGARYADEACSFTLEAREDSEVELLLYEGHAKEPTRTLKLDDRYRNGSVFAVHVSPLGPVDTCDYNFLLNGQVVQDPCARKIVGRERFGKAKDPQKPHQVRCQVPAKEEDWEEGLGKTFRLEDLIVYKVHVRGYTKRCPLVSPEKRGTFAGLEEMIGYWKELGVSAIELMPCYEFEENPAYEAPPQGGAVTRKEEAPRINFWGYGPGFYEAPKESYCAGTDPEKEVRSFIRALHEAGLAIILEFYFPAGTDPKASLHALHTWRLSYHVDGFHLVGEGAPLSLILRDALLSDALIFSTWEDVPRQELERKIPSHSYARYHAGFLEDMRRFLKGDEGMVDAVRYRFTRQEEDSAVINYIACQDGFTLQDMVSYNYRHNEANGEGGKDGSEANFSWNCGVEGPCKKGAIQKLRKKQMKNALSLVLLSRGTPLIYGGDEFGNSQKGNNNAYCQDNPVGWVDWRGREKNQDLVDFVKRLIGFRRDHGVLHRGGLPKERAYQGKGFPAVSFHGERAWVCSNEPSSRLLGVLYAGPCLGDEHFYYIAMNFYWEEQKIALPALEKGGSWRLEMLTSEDEPWLEEAKERTEKTLTMPPRSLALLTGTIPKASQKAPAPKKERAKEKAKEGEA